MALKKTVENSVDADNIPSTIGEDSRIERHCYFAGFCCRVLPRFLRCEVIGDTHVDSNHTRTYHNSKGSNFAEQEHVLKLGRNANIVAIQKR